MSSDNTLDQTPDAPSQEGAPENECNHPCGCSQATYLIVEPETGETNEYDFVAPLGYRRVQRDEITERFVMDMLDRFEIWLEDLYNKVKTRQEDKRNKHHIGK